MSEQNGQADDGDQIVTEEEHHRQQVKRLLAQLDAAERANQETMQQLQNRGMGANPLGITRLRMEVFISMTLGGQDSIARIQFELAWQRELQKYLAEIYQEKKASKLHIPGRS